MTKNVFSASMPLKPGTVLTAVINDPHGRHTGTVCESPDLVSLLSGTDWLSLSGPREFTVCGTFSDSQFGIALTEISVCGNSVQCPTHSVPLLKT